MHYGSVYTMSNYESKVHNAYFTANFMAMPELRIFGTVAYNKAEASLDEVIMPDVEDRLDGALENQDFTFEDLPSYADLDFSMVNLQLGFEYRFTPRVTWTADGTYGDLTDNAPYIFGDESGSIVIVRSGLKIDF